MKRRNSTHSFWASCVRDLRDTGKASDVGCDVLPQTSGGLNRHYVAEGVRLFSQETWRRVCGPQGGARPSC